MTAQTVALVDEWLQETYASKTFFRPYQEDYTPLLSDLDECPDEPVKGKRWNVPLYIATAWNVRTGAEGGPQATVGSDTVVQGQVPAQEFKGTVKLTELLERQGTREAHFNGGALDHQMKQRSMELAKLMQIQFWGRNTGMLGVVDYAVSGDVTVPLRLPWGIRRVRKNMRIGFYNAETGGSLQGATYYTISNVNRTYRNDPAAVGWNTTSGTITLSAAATLTAGWYIFGATGTGASETDYGYAPFGIEGLISTATEGPSTFLGKARGDYPELVANRMHNSGEPRALTEDLMREMADLIWDNGCEIDQIRCGAGIINKVAALSTSDKRYNVSNWTFPTYVTGHKEGQLLFAYDKVTTTFKKDPQCPARRMYFLSFKDTFYKHTSAELGFLNRGGSILLPVPSSSGGGYDYAIQARLYAAANISNYFPLGNGILDDLEDTSWAGD
jgi:hypothetical protein